MSSFSMLQLLEVRTVERPNFTTEIVNEKAKWKLEEEFSRVQRGDAEALENLGAQVYRNYIDYNDGSIFEDYREGYLAAFKLGMYVIQNLVTNYNCLYKAALPCVYQGLYSAPQERLSEFFDIRKREDLISAVSSAIEKLPE
ncbi:hypothetical protein PIROE2DRAFT_63244 [Piromyces sp. E2]|nr:hypothetical protein PIROE2DRAFT_63244 [Piromyces sp. E2]|eukprot:OUM60274.1 hypothetical protein PIROE2DRAFT_63244 [Piromyces sp. E2]